MSKGKGGEGEGNGERGWKGRWVVNERDGRWEIK